MKDNRNDKNHNFTLEHKEVECTNKEVKDYHKAINPCNHVINTEGLIPDNKEWKLGMSVKETIFNEFLKRASDEILEYVKLIVKSGYEYQCF